MEAVKQLLTRGGVIGGIFNDFDPLFRFYVVYRNQLISVHDQVWCAQVKQRTLEFQDFCEPAHYAELMEELQEPHINITGKLKSYFVSIFNLLKLKFILLIVIS